MPLLAKKAAETAAEGAGSRRRGGQAVPTAQSSETLRGGFTPATALLLALAGTDRFKVRSSRRCYGSQSVAESGKLCFAVESTNKPAPIHTASDLQHATITWTQYSVLFERKNVTSR